MSIDDAGRRLIQAPKLEQPQIMRYAMTPTGSKTLVRQRGAWGEHPTEKNSDRGAMLQPTSLQGVQLGRTILQQDQALGADPMVQPIQPKIPWRFTPLCRESVPLTYPLHVCSRARTCKAET